MPHLHRAFLPVKDPFQMHQATHIGGGNIFRTVSKMIGYTVLSHFHGDGFFRNAKGAPESATFIGTVQPDQLNAIDQVQQSLRF
jgi:hypothetical protein